VNQNTNKPNKILVIGIGEDGLAGLDDFARLKIKTADVLVGGLRHLNFMPDFAGQILDWSLGIKATLDVLENVGEKKIVVLASGDPLYFGVGKNIIEKFGIENVLVIPKPGAVTLTCAAMGWSQPDVQVVTVHGRALENLNLHLAPKVRLCVLSQDGTTPAAVAKLLCNQGYSNSQMTVFEHLGGPRQSQEITKAKDWCKQSSADLNSLAIELVTDQTARPLSRVGGLPDDAFEHDGQLTKRAMRAVTISTLAPLAHEILWDFGGGAGSISIEWMRAHTSCRAVAIERDPVRAKRIERNAHKLGVPKLSVVVADNAQALDQLSGRPQAIFIGGGLSAANFIDRAFAMLSPGGRLVANAVTDKSRDILCELQDRYGGEMMTVSLEGKFPVTQILIRKKL